MSYELIGDGGMSLGQFASNNGYTQLIRAAKKYPALTDLIRTGTSTSVLQVQTDLVRLIKDSKDKDVKSTAMGLLKLIKGQRQISVSDGMV